MTLEARDVVWEAGGTRVLDGVTLRAQPGRVLGLLGPNGSGKSSLLRCLAGLRRPTRGAVLLDGRELRAWPRRAVARRVALLAQEAATELDLSVADVVALGRLPHRGPLGGESPADRAAVAHALALVGLDGWERRRWHTLSGGERQRVQLARALAQEPRELLLDEPTNHLDVRQALELLELVRGLGRTAVVALHDLQLAARYCDALAVLRAGRIVAAGPTAAVLTAGLVADVYGVACEIGVEADGRPEVRGLRPLTRAAP
ncbi:MAG TPA: ABC transporter ATP-binding protein [Capillimicrobium sp.]|nr:ABC transporter ATP-binding protein [Capillimicrobium sp.]